MPVPTAPQFGQPIPVDAAGAADCRAAAHWWHTPAGSFQHTSRHTHSVHPRHWWNWSATSSAASRSRWSLVTPRVLLRP